MPDIWTRYPGIVRRILEEAGFKCEVEPKILPRSIPETCQFTKENFLGEIYIHQLDFISNNTVIVLIIGIAIGIIAMLLLKKLRKLK